MSKWIKKPARKPYPRSSAPVLVFMGPVTFIRESKPQAIKLDPKISIFGPLSECRKAIAKMVKDAIEGTGKSNG